MTAKTPCTLSFAGEIGPSKNRVSAHCGRRELRPEVAGTEVDAPPLAFYTSCEMKPNFNFLFAR
jgi:hypothetical protein